MNKALISLLMILTIGLTQSQPNFHYDDVKDITDSIQNNAYKESQITKDTTLARSDSTRLFKRENTSHSLNFQLFGPVYISSFGYAWENQVYEKLSSFCSSIIYAQTWQNMVPNYSFENHDLTGWYETENKSGRDSLMISKISEVSHGIFFEILGKEGLYSIGYERSTSKNKHAFGFGAGTSFWRPKVLGTISYNQYSISSYYFYEYGVNWGLRTAINLSCAINPIMFTSRLDDLENADKPTYIRLSPAISSGIFYKPKQNRFEFILNLYGIYSIARIQSPSGDLWTDYNENYFWSGLTVKYNFFKKIRYE